MFSNQRQIHRRTALLLKITSVYLILFCNPVPIIARNIHCSSVFNPTYSKQDISLDYQNLLNLKEKSNIPDSFIKKYDSKTLAEILVKRIYEKRERYILPTENAIPFDWNSETTLMIYFPSHVVEKIISQGFLNQYQTGTSNGVLQPLERQKTEDNLIGLNLGPIDNIQNPRIDLRPKYVAIDFGNLKLPFKIKIPGTEYGDLIAVLKDSVKKRSLWFMGDSLYYDNPWDYSENKIDLEKRGTFYKTYIDKKFSSTIDEKEENQHRTPEAEVFGALDITDVKQWLVTQNASDTTIENLKKTGLPIRQYQRRDGKIKLGKFVFKGNSAGKDSHKKQESLLEDINAQDSFTEPNKVFNKGSDQNKIFVIASIDKSKLRSDPELKENIESFIKSVFSKNNQKLSLKVCAALIDGKTFYNKYALQIDAILSRAFSRGNLEAQISAIHILSKIETKKALPLIFNFNLFRSAEEVQDKALKIIENSTDEEIFPYLRRLIKEENYDLFLELSESHVSYRLIPDLLMIIQKSNSYGSVSGAFDLLVQIPELSSLKRPITTAKSSGHLTSELRKKIFKLINTN